MYLDAGTLLAIMIALTTSTTLLIATAVQNARLEKSRDRWRYEYNELKHYFEYE